MRLAGLRDVIPSWRLPLALASCVLLAGDVQARTPDALQCQSKVWRAVADVGPSCHGRGVDHICPGAALGQARNRTERILAKRQIVAPPDACIPYLCVAGETPFTCASKIVTGNGAPEPDTLDDWQVNDFRCVGKSARLLGRLAKGIRRCERAGAEADVCRDDIVASYTTKLEQVVWTFLDAGASLHHCMLGGCQPNADLSPCIRAVVSGTDDDRPPVDVGPPPPSGDPGDVTPEEAECRSVSAIVLAEFDARVAKCLADADDVPACLLDARGKREAKVVDLLDERVRPEVCFPGVCTAGQTPEACAFAVFELHAPGSGGAPPPSDDGEAARVCREGARNILDAVADGAAVCRAKQQVEAAAGRAFDVDACVQAVVDAQRPDLLEYLESQLAVGVSPDACLPRLCAESGDSASACADAAIASVLDAS